MTENHSDFVRTLAEQAHRTIHTHAAELTQLDQAIGDGDHGINLSRGFAAVAEIAGELENLEFGEALNKIGMTLIMKVGGASGPLYGSFLLAMGKASPSMPATRRQLADALDAGIQGIKQRGRSDTGCKTMLDVLVPVAQSVRSGASVSEIRACAVQALESTRGMLAKKGRAAFLGERSIGHLDPGGRSSCLLIHTICDVLENS